RALLRPAAAAREGVAARPAGGLDELRWERAGAAARPPPPAERSGDGRGAAVHELLSELRPPDELSAPRLNLQLAVLDEHRAAEEHEVDRPGDLGSLVEVVVGARVVRRRRDRVLPRRVEDDDVRVR